MVREIAQCVQLRQAQFVQRQLCSSSAMLPVMGNQLKTLRDAEDWTQEETAEKFGVSKSQYVKLERGDRRLTEQYITKAAEVFGVAASAIIAGPQVVPLMGYVGAGAEVEPDFEQIPEGGLEQIEVPFPLPGDMVAFRVQGDSMLPAFEDGMVIIVWREERKPREAYLGRRVIVRTADGRRFLKQIIAGDNGAVTLLSLNASTPPIMNVRAVWIGEIFTYFPAEAVRSIARKIERQGGIQGRLKLTAAE